MYLINTGITCRILLRDLCCIFLFFYIKLIAESDKN